MKTPRAENSAQLFTRVIEEGLYTMESLVTLLWFGQILLQNFWTDDFLTLK